MKEKIGIELVYNKKEESNIHGEECYDGYVSLNGQRFQFWNMPWESVVTNLKDKVEWITEKLSKPEDVVVEEEKKQPRINKWWKLKYHLFRKIPKFCPYCGGEVIARGFVGVNKRYQCRSCDVVLIR